MRIKASAPFNSFLLPHSQLFLLKNVFAELKIAIMARKVITIIAGAFILFGWNAISWMALPFHGNTLQSIPESAFDSELLEDNLPKDGVYHYPGLPKENTPSEFKALEKKLKEGPRITLMVFKKGSTEFFDPKSFALNFVFNLLTVLILLTVVQQLTNKSLRKILLTLLSIGLIVALTSDLPQMNWYMFPLEYTLVNVFDHLISFLLLGLLFGFYTFKTQGKWLNKKS
jgi:hypothetical protein